MSKNTTGNLYIRTIRRENKLVETIDKRTVKGQDLENVDPIWNNHTVNQEGERVWTF